MPPVLLWVQKTLSSGQKYFGLVQISLDIATIKFSLINLALIRPNNFWTIGNKFLANRRHQKSILAVNEKMGRQFWRVRSLTRQFWRPIFHLRLFGQNFGGLKHR